MPELQGELLRLAKRTDLSEVGAANVWAGTSGLDLLGALNAKAGNTLPTNWRDLDGVCNQLAGTTGLAAPGALSRIPTPP